jgi:hypothetical protein
MVLHALGQQRNGREPALQVSRGAPARRNDANKLEGIKSGKWHQAI